MSLACGVEMNIAEQSLSNLGNFSNLVICEVVHWLSDVIHYKPLFI